MEESETMQSVLPEEKEFVADFFVVGSASHCSEPPRSHSPLDSRERARPERAIGIEKYEHLARRDACAFVACAARAEEFREFDDARAFCARLICRFIAGAVDRDDNLRRHF